jgi:hypothetical protein
MRNIPTKAFEAGNRSLKSSWLPPFVVIHNRRTEAILRIDWRELKRARHSDGDHCKLFWIRDVSSYEKNNSSIYRTFFGMSTPRKLVRAGSFAMPSSVIISYYCIWKNALQPRGITAFTETWRRRHSIARARNRKPNQNINKIEEESKKHNKKSVFVPPFNSHNRRCQ